MMPARPSLHTGFVLALTFSIGSWASSAQPDQGLLASSKAGSSHGDQVGFEIQPEGEVAVFMTGGGEKMPSVFLVPTKGDSLDLGEYSRIHARVRNDGEKAATVAFRVDNPGHWREAPWNSESVRLGPGETGEVVVFFGRSYGFRPGFELDPRRVSKLVFFVERPVGETRFTVESILPKGMTGETLAAFEHSRSKVPPGGILFGEWEAQPVGYRLSAGSGARVETRGDPEVIRIRFPGGGDSSVYLVPDAGLWDLRAATRIEVSVRNVSPSPVQPVIRLESLDGGRRTVRSEKAIAPGVSGQVVVPFASDQPWQPGVGQESGLDSRLVRSVSLDSGGGATPVEYEVVGIRADSEVIDANRARSSAPPVPGDWILTFAEEFEGDTLDRRSWNVSTDNYWDRKCHFSGSNVIVGDGVARLRFERKRLRYKGEDREYTSGFLDTFGKWTQRYGYFEARMKLPSAPGLWPAFWMMPDRGPSDAPRWKRESTDNGGMEFDIMEHLTRWGPHRYNVAFHWDGYGKKHQHDGTSGIYGGHDEEGFLTAGLLWLPGKAVYFCNRKEVARWESPRVSSVPSLIRFTHVSGGWDNDPIDDRQLPDDFVIDYVRCWQLRE
jgi:beta-glucanase (GH16 family)